MDQFGSWDRAIEIVQAKYKEKVSLLIIQGTATDMQLGETSGLFYAMQVLKKGKEQEIYEFENDMAHKENLSNDTLTWSDL